MGLGFISNKPNGYTSVAPYLIVDGASRTIEFIVRAFAAVELRRFADPSGKIMHAEVRIDDTVLMLADGAEGWPPIPAHAQGIGFLLRFRGRTTREQ